LQGEDTVLFWYGGMNTSDATSDMCQTDGVFFANDLYTLEIRNMKGTLCTVVGLVSYTDDLRTSEQ
jgi:hypothetical protein